MSRLKEIFVKSADPYERGYQHGSQIKAELNAVIEDYRQVFLEKGYEWQEVLDMAMDYVPFLEKNMFELMQEAKGIADGAGVDLSLVMVMNTRYELLKFIKGKDNFENNECTCFLVSPEATQMKETIGGQNWDNAAFVGKNLYVLHIDEENGTRIVGITEPAQLIRSGMNSHGLSVNCSTLLSTKDHRGIAIPTNFMRRRLLQCQTLEEARELVKNFKPCISLNYVVSSAIGDGFIYETTPVENYEVELHKGIATQGNDIQINPEIERFVNVDEKHVVHFRGQRLNYLLKKKRGDITVEYIEECLRDHDGYPGSICNHTKSCTIASVIYCVNRLKAYICWGNPCEEAYETYYV